MLPLLAFTPFESRLRDSFPGSWDERLKCLYQRPNITIKTKGITLEIDSSLKKRLPTKKKKNVKDITDIDKIKSNPKLVLSRLSQSLSGE